MSHRYDLILGVNAGPREELHGEMSDEEWDILHRFLLYFDELAMTRMGGGCQVSWKLTFDRDGSVASTGVVPPDDDIAAFLHRLRPFVLKGEATHFHRICSLIVRLVDHPGMRALLQQQRGEFDGTNFRSQIELSSNEVIVNSEDTLQHWLNSSEYHRDPLRQAELAKVHSEVLPPEATRPLFVSMLIDKAKAIAEIARVARLLVKQGTKGEEVRFSNLRVKPPGRPPSEGG